MDMSKSILDGFVQFDRKTILELGWTKEKMAKCCIQEKKAEFDYALPQLWLDEFCAKYPEFPYNLVTATTFSLYFRGIPHIGPHIWSCCKEIDMAIKEFNGYK